MSKFSLGLRVGVAKVTHPYLEGLGALWGRLEEIARDHREGPQAQVFREFSLTSGLQGNAGEARSWVIQPCDLLAQW